MEDRLQNQLKSHWKRLLYPLIMGLILGIGGFYISVKGYCVLIYYSWFLLLPLVIVISIPCSFQRTFKAYLIRVGLIAAMATVLTGLGLGMLLIKKQSICRNLNSIISELENHRKANGAYPPDLSGMHKPGDLRIREGRTTETGIVLEGLNDSDAVFYLSPDYFLCIVPITKKLPMSITRFYAYRWSTDDPSWKSEKLIWWLGISKEAPAEE